MDMASRPNITKGAARLNRLIDLNAYPIQPVLRILLKDRTTGENIIWATNNYEKLGNTYHSAATMRLKDLVKLDKSVIQPRIYKTLELQKQRTKVNAEVFTPSWICCLMNNHLDDIWFGRKDVFNKMKDKSWRATNRPIEFPASGSKTWQGYVDSRRIEITCGEAPYLVSRYDTTTGKVIPISHRIGILDRKLRVVNENAEDEAEWIKWTLRAYQATYGYEYQGDNLLIARINMLMTFVDYMQARWERNPTEDELKVVAFIISWNVWQMNGLTYKTSYDADADRKRLQKIIDECDELIRLYDERINPSEEDGTCSVEEVQAIDSMLESKKNELTMEDLIEIVKQEDLYDLAYLYADYHGIRIIDGDVPDYSAELDKLRQEMVEDKKDVQRLRDETYAEKCMIADAPDCLIKNWRMRRTEYFRDIAQKNKGKGIMKFDFCIGNPPYQETRENTSDRPIYNLFVDAAATISDRVELITPARFLFNAGRTPKEWNKKMLGDPHFKVLMFEQDSANVFSNTDIKGGVAITYRDANSNFGSIGQFSQFKELNSLANKMKSISGFVGLDTIMYPYSTYSLSEVLFSEHTDIRIVNKDDPNDKVGFHVLSNGKIITTNIFELLSDLFFEVKPVDDCEYVCLLGRTNNERAYRYINAKYINLAENYNKWKIIIPKSNGSGAIGEVLSTPLVGTPLVGYTQSFLGIGALDTRYEADALMKYVQTKFARATLGILKITQDNPPEKWKYVPIQDFTENSDIDWTKSISEIDQQLYKKYGLSQDEIDFIETKVKEME